jgi:hypothetical protein
MHKATKGHYKAMLDLLKYSVDTVDPAMFKSSTERTVSLCTTEAETYAGVICVQDMLYRNNVLESLGLKVKLPMILEMDN